MGLALPHSPRRRLAGFSNRGHHNLDTIVFTWLASLNQAVRCRNSMTKHPRIDCLQLPHYLYR